MVECSRTVLLHVVLISFFLYKFAFYCQGLMRKQLIKYLGFNSVKYVFQTVCSNYYIFFLQLLLFLFVSCSNWNILSFSQTTLQLILYVSQNLFSYPTQAWNSLCPSDLAKSNAFIKIVESVDGPILKIFATSHFFLLKSTICKLV